MSNQGYDPYAQQGQNQPGQDPWGQPAAPQYPAGQPSADPYAQAQYPTAGQQYGQDPYAQAYAQDPYAAYGQGAMPGCGVAPARPSVNFMQAMKMYFKNYAVFSGRASQSEFWWAALGTWIIYFLGYLLIFAPLMTGNTPGAMSSIFGGLFSLVSLGLIVPSIAVLVRRLHDVDKSGWYYFIALVPFVGAIILLVFLAGASNPAGARFDAPDGSQPAIEPA